MSALSCGCDIDADWICEAHRPTSVTEAAALLGSVTGRRHAQQDNACEEAIRGTVQRFKDRLAQEEQMKDTVKMYGYGPTAAQVFCEQAVATANAVQTRDDLLNRIATLEAELHATCSTYARDQSEMRMLLSLERQEHERAKARITELERELHVERSQWAPDTRTVRRCAKILADFHNRVLSMSSVQPLLMLAEELNPDLAERKR